MKRELQKMMKAIFVLLMLFWVSMGIGQSAGFNTTFVVLSLNGGSDVYYDLQAATVNPDFQNADLGIFCAGATGITLKGAEHNNYKCGGCDITGTTLYYRVTLVGASPAGFSNAAISFASDFDNGCGGKDQQWKNVSLSADLTAGLAAGNYKLEIYSSQETTCSGTQYADNGGAYFTVYFTVGAPVTYYLDADADGFGNYYVTTVSCTGAPAGYVANGSDTNDNQRTYADADGDGFGSTVFAPSGPTNNSDCDDLHWQYLDADGDGFGSNTLVACGVTNNSDCNDNQIQYLDADGDGFGSTTQVACGVVNNIDCDDLHWQYLDADGDGFGSNTLVACGVTNNYDCNDNQLQYLDADGDGFGSETIVYCGVTNHSDCDDLHWQYLDADGDGFGSNTLVACGVTNNWDCNDNQIQYLDADGDSFGSTTLVACGVVNNIDCDDHQLQYLDSDGDGFGSNTLVACGVTNNWDCNDNQIQYLDADGDGFGSTIQVPCGVANNIDCNDNQLQYLDSDGDGFGSATLVACGVTNRSDCNDNQLQYLDEDGDSFGSTTLVACGVVNNIDCDDHQLQYLDSDGDGFGSPTLVACGVTNRSDCNDNQLQYLDEDGDGFGSTTLVACGVTNNIDCNDHQLQFLDSDSDGFGSNTLVACGVTNNYDCNDNQLQYLDADGDGLGADTFVACSGVLNHGDCDDANAAIQGAFTFYVDADGDGYGAITAAPRVMCAVNANTPPGAHLSPYNTDCNDNDPNTISGPSIETQPESTFICATVGATASYTVATVMSNATYEWQYRVVTKANPNPVWITITAANAGTVYSDYATATLAVTRTAKLPATGTEYRVIVSGGCGSITSDSATITILSTVKAGTIASAASVCLGDNITLTLTKQAGTSLQWQSALNATGDFTDIPGATGTTYTIAGATADVDKSYRVVVANSCNNTSAISPIKTIKVDPASVAGTIAGGGVVCSGSNAALKITGNVGKIQWEYSTDGTSYDSAPKAADAATTPFGTSSTSNTAASYMVTGLLSDVYFRAKVTSGACSASYTAPVHYTIGTTAIAGTISPNSSTICPATAAVLELSAATGVVTWQKATNLASPVWTSTTNHTLTCPTGNLSASAAYRAMVTIGGCSTVYSDIAYVYVVAKPVAKTITANVTSPTGKTAATALCATSNSKVLTAGNGTVGAIQWQWSSTSPTSGFVDIDGATGTSYAITFPNYVNYSANGGANYYRLKVTNSCGAEVFGAVMTLYFKACGDEGNGTWYIKAAMPKSFNVVAYPNPYSASFNLKLTTASEATVAISVYDMTGKVIDKREVMPNEMENVQLGDNYASGIYNVVITQGNDVKTLRVIKR